VDFHNKEMALILQASDQTCFIIFNEKDEHIGFIELSLRNIVDECLSSPVGYIEGIYLTSCHRGLGLGRQLVEFAADWFKSKGCTEMATDAEIDNVDAQRFHQHVGFTETSRIVEYKKSLMESYGVVDEGS